MGKFKKGILLFIKTAKYITWVELCLLYFLGYQISKSDPHEQKKCESEMSKVSGFHTWIVFIHASLYF
jgi:hypothetical protein